jgi:hypothetical protein
MRFYNFEIVIEKEPDDEGYSAYKPESARLLQQWPHDRRDQAQHARRNPAARRLTASASRAGAAATLSFLSKQGSTKRAASNRLRPPQVRFPLSQLLPALRAPWSPGNGATDSQGLMDHDEDKVNRDWLTSCERRPQLRAAAGAGMLRKFL